eukprot:COSAG02_NODE_1963_length_10250_cov_112.556300_7_plen_79_part_00
MSCVITLDALSVITHDKRPGVRPTLIASGWIGLTDDRKGGSRLHNVRPFLKKGPHAALRRIQSFDVIRNEEMVAWNHK